MARVHLYLAQNQVYPKGRYLETADRLLEQLILLSEADDHTGLRVELLALRALVLGGLGHQQPALTALIRSLELARPEGYIRSIWGQPCQA